MGGAEGDRGGDIGGRGEDRWISGGVGWGKKWLKIDGRSNKFD